MTLEGRGSLGDLGGPESLGHHRHPLGPEDQVVLEILVSHFLQGGLEGPHLLFHQGDLWVPQVLGVRAILEILLLPKVQDFPEYLGFLACNYNHYIHTVSLVRCCYKQSPRVSEVRSVNKT